jgi:hypothetical protein
MFNGAGGEIVAGNCAHAGPVEAIDQPSTINATEDRLIAYAGYDAVGLPIIAAHNEFISETPTRASLRDIKTSL